MLEDKLSSAHNTINILQHTVAEKEADLQMAANSCKVFETFDTDCFSLSDGMVGETGMS